MSAFVFVLLRLLAGSCSLQHGTSSSARDVADDFSDVQAMTKVTLAPEDPTPDGIRELFNGLASIPAPAREDRSSPAAGRINCDGDYGAACPIDFEPVGGVCYPQEGINSPCGPTVFQNMTKEAKMRWEMLCGSFFPCAGGSKDFASPCPNGWSAVQGEGWRCRPTPDTIGVCQEVVSFEGFNLYMLTDWQQKCNAFWPALDVTDLDRQMEAEDLSKPIGLGATVRRLLAS
jgi:CPW-WPC domain-containing protein